MLCPARTRMKRSAKKPPSPSSTSSSRRWLSQTGRPTLTSRRTTWKIRSGSIRTRAFRSAIAASDRPAWKRTSNRSSSANRRPSTARCETQIQSTRAIRRRIAKSCRGSSIESTSCPTASSATFRRATLASGETGIPREQRDDVGHERTIGAEVPPQDAQHPLAVPRPEREDRLHHRVGALGRHRGGRPRQRGGGLGGRGVAERQRRHLREGPHHRLARRQVFDLRQVEADGLVEQAAFERLDVAARDAARDHQRPQRADHGNGEDDRVPGSLGRADDDRGEARPQQVAGAVEADVDDRLRCPLVARRHRRVEQLVGRAEEGHARDVLGASRGGGDGHPREDEGAEAAGHDGERRGADRGREPELLEHRAAQRHLRQEREHARRGVVQGEEAQQHVAAPDLGHRPGLEDVVHQRRAERRQQHERGQVAQVGVAGDDRQAGRNHGRQPVQRRRRLPLAVATRREPPHDPGAGHVQDRQDREHRAGGAPHGRPIGNQAAREAAERPRGPDVPEAALRRPGIEPLAQQRPEPRDEHRGQPEHVEIEDDGARPRGRPAQHPLEDDQDRARDEGEREGGGRGTPGSSRATSAGRTRWRRRTPPSPSTADR